MLKMKPEKIKSEQMLTYVKREKNMKRLIVQGMPAPARMPALDHYFSMESSSTSKMRVWLGPITEPAPCSPYASLEGI
jgi:hypothetical protein